MKPVALLDTNVWVSAFLNKQGTPARLVQAWLDGTIDIVIALPILEEIGDQTHSTNADEPSRLY